jgi:uncharacterized protein
MIGDALVFDSVNHIFNFDAANARGSAGDMFSQHLFAFHNVLTPPGEPLLSAEEFLRTWSPEEIREMVYEQSNTDMARRHAAAAHGPVPRRAVAVAGVRRLAAT